MSFIVAQIFQTSSGHAKHGAFALGVVYIVFCLANLALSSYVTQLLGVRLSLIFASMTYVVFVASNIKYNIWILYISAFLLGLGAALFWTAQGVYVVTSAIKHERVNNLIQSSTQGLMNGIFLGLFQLNQTIGNLIAAYLFYLKMDQWIIFTIMTGIGCFGVIGFIFLRPVKTPKTTGKIFINHFLCIMLYFMLNRTTFVYS
jgi:MFS family permease